MKRFETPILNVEKFDLVNIVTASGEVLPTEPSAVEAASIKLEEVGIKTENTFTITL